MRLVPSRVLASVPAVLALACGQSPAPAPPRAARIERPAGIVLVTVDTLRRDVLGCYGYPRPTSPRIDDLAAEGVLFERAVAPMATTLPVHLSLLTGLYPHQHGVRSNRSAVRQPWSSQPGRRSLVELLAAAGWRTAAFVSAPPVAASTGIGAGFALFDEPSEPPPSARPAGPAIRSAAETVERAAHWLGSDQERPFFLWVHLWDPHEPNAPEARHVEALRGAPAASLVRGARELDPSRLPALFAEQGPAGMFFGREAERVAARAARGEPAFDESLLDDLIERYDADVRAVDESVGRLLDALAATGLAERTIFALTADHGQSLGDHDWLGHGRISATNVLVPLIVRFPPGLLPQPARVEQAVSLVDLLPSLMARIPGEPTRDFLAQASGEDVFSGRFRRQVSLVERTSAVIRETPPGPEHALIGARWKLVRLAGAPARLYDLLEDPGERRDLAAREPALVLELERELERLLAERPAPATRAEAPRARDERARRRLKALEELGYAGEDEGEERETREND